MGNNSYYILNITGTISTLLIKIESMRQQDGTQL